MSWGERSCTKERAPKNEYGGCAVATIETCNHRCEYYLWDGVSKTEAEMYIEELTKKEEVKQEKRVYKKPSKNRIRKLKRKGKLK